MFYSSCFDIEGKNDVVILCQCEVVSGVDNYVIKNLSFSDGEKIYERKEIESDDVQLHIEESQRELVWDGFIRALSANSLPESKGDELEGEELFSQIVCVPSDHNNGHLVMVKRVGVITRRLAEIEVPLSEEAELDLFLLAKRMYQYLCTSNINNQNMESENLALKADVETLHQDIDTMKQLTIERDRKVNSIMVGLLNEKKKKIRQLKRILQVSGLDVPEEDLSDSEFINKNVTDEVSELISPGKRRVAAWKETRPIKRLKSVKRKLDIKQEEDPIKKHSDDFDDFEFLGISKSPEKKPADHKESEVDTESYHDDHESREDSDSSIDIKRESDHDVKMEYNDINNGKNESSSDDTATDIESFPRSNVSNQHDDRNSSSEETDT